VLFMLLEAPGEVVVVVDSKPPAAGEGGSRDFAWCSVEDDHALFRDDVRLAGVSSGAPPPELAGHVPSGRWIGMLRVRGEGRDWVRAAVAELRGRADFDALDRPDLLGALVAADRPVRVVYIHGHWLDVNRLEDLDRAGRFTSSEAGREHEDRERTP
jgi:phosphoenolpyruvate phosphomutase